MIVLKHNNIKNNNKEKKFISKGMGRYFAMEVPIPSYIELTHARNLSTLQRYIKNVKKQNY